MYIKEAIQNILEKNLDEMKNNFQAALTEKAIEQLEEKKIKIAQGYFAEEKGQSPGSKARNKPRTPGEAGMRDDDEEEDNNDMKGQSPGSKARKPRTPGEAGMRDDDEEKPSKLISKFMARKK